MNTSYFYNFSSLQKRSRSPKVKPLTFLKISPKRQPHEFNIFFAKYWASKTQNTCLLIVLNTSPSIIVLLFPNSNQTKSATEVTLYIKIKRIYFMHFGVRIYNQSLNQTGFCLKPMHLYRHSNCLSSDILHQFSKYV